MKTKHTPGPWHKGTGNGEGSVYSETGRARLETGGTTLYPICAINHGWNEEEDTANAQLIAAAPELLEALLGLCNVATHPNCTKSQIRTIAREAYFTIVKATAKEVQK